MTIDKKTFPTRFVQLHVSLILSDPTPASYWSLRDAELIRNGQPTASKKSAVSATLEVHQVFLTGSSEIQ